MIKNWCIMENYDGKKGLKYLKHRDMEHLSESLENQKVSFVNKKTSVSKKFEINMVKNPVDFKDFYLTPFQVYVDDVNWVSPLWLEVKSFFNKKNPFWKHVETILFVARWNKKPIGRIAAFVDHNYCRYNGEKTGFFGFFECVENYEVAKALFQNAERWLKAKGMTMMRGPINGRVDIGFGFLYEGFDSPPAYMSPYSPSYYINFARRYGMSKNRDFLGYTLDLKNDIPAEVRRAAKIGRRKGVEIRGFSRIRAGRDIDIWISLLLKTFSEHYGFVPVSADEIKARFGIKHARWLADNKMFLFALVENKPVGFIWSTPDYNQFFKNNNGKIRAGDILRYPWLKRKINRGRFHLIGCLKNHRNLDIATCLNYYTIVEMKKRGYRTAEIGPVDEKNDPSKKIIEKMKAYPSKKFRVFETKIEPLKR